MDCAMGVSAPDSHELIYKMAALFFIYLGVALDNPGLSQSLAVNFSLSFIGGGYFLAT